MLVVIPPEEWAGPARFGRRSRRSRDLPALTRSLDRSALPTGPPRPASRAVVGARPGRGSARPLKRSRDGSRPGVRPSPGGSLRPPRTRSGLSRRSSGREGLHGVGQSSWGPTLYGVQRTRALESRREALLERAPESLRPCRPELCVLDLERAAKGPCSGPSPDFGSSSIRGRLGGSPFRERRASRVTSWAGRRIVPRRTEVEGPRWIVAWFARIEPGPDWTPASGRSADFWRFTSGCVERQGPRARWSGTPFRDRRERPRSSGRAPTGPLGAWSSTSEGLLELAESRPGRRRDQARRASSRRPPQDADGALALAELSYRAGIDRQSRACPMRRSPGSETPPPWPRSRSGKSGARPSPDLAVSRSTTGPSPACSGSPRTRGNARQNRDWQKTSSKTGAIVFESPTPGPRPEAGSPTSCPGRGHPGRRGWQHIYRNGGLGVQLIAHRQVENGSDSPRPSRPLPPPRIAPRPRRPWSSRRSASWKARTGDGTR